MLNVCCTKMERRQRGTDVRSVEELVQRSYVPVGQVDDVYVVPDLQHTKTMKRNHRQDDCH